MRRGQNKLSELVLACSPKLASMRTLTKSPFFAPAFTDTERRTVAEGGVLPRAGSPRPGDARSLRPLARWIVLNSKLHMNICHGNHQTDAGCGNAKMGEKFMQYRTQFLGQAC